MEEVVERFMLSIGGYSDSVCNRVHNQSILDELIKKQSIENTKPVDKQSTSNTEEPEVTVICVDNSYYLDNRRGGGAHKAQARAIILYSEEKLKAHPDNEVGILGMGLIQGDCFQKPTCDLDQIRLALKGLTYFGQSSIPILQALTLLLSSNLPKRRLLLFFGGALISMGSRKLESYALRLKECNVAVDVVNFGIQWLPPTKKKLLEAFVKAADNDGNSHCLYAPSGSATSLGQQILCSPLAPGGLHMYEEKKKEQEVKKKEMMEKKLQNKMGLQLLTLKEKKREQRFIKKKKMEKKLKKKMELAALAKKKEEEEEEKKKEEEEVKKKRKEEEVKRKEEEVKRKEEEVVKRKEEEVVKKKEEEVKKKEELEEVAERFMLSIGEYSKSCCERVHNQSILDELVKKQSILNTKLVDKQSTLNTEEPEVTVICVDNSYYLDNRRGGGAHKTQARAIVLYSEEKLKAHPDNEVGILGMGLIQGDCCQKPTRDLDQIRLALKGLTYFGQSSIPVRQALALLLDSNLPKRRLLLFFGGALISMSSHKLESYAKRLKEFNVAVDVVNFGMQWLPPTKKKLLEAFTKAADNDGNSHYLYAPSGSATSLGQQILCSPLAPGGLRMYEEKKKEQEVKKKEQMEKKSQKKREHCLLTLKEKKREQQFIKEKKMEKKLKKKMELAALAKKKEEEEEKKKEEEEVKKKRKEEEVKRKEEEEVKRKEEEEVKRREEEEVKKKQEEEVKKKEEEEVKRKQEEEVKKKEEEEVKRKQEEEVKKKEEEEVKRKQEEEVKKKEEEEVKRKQEEEVKKKEEEEVKRKKEEVKNKKKMYNKLKNYRKKLAARAEEEVKKKEEEEEVEKKDEKEEAEKKEEEEEEVKIKEKMEPKSGNLQKTKGKRYELLA